MAKRKARSAARPRTARTKAKPSIGELDILATVSELDSDKKEGDTASACGDIVMFIRKSENLTFAEFRDAMGDKKLTDVLAGYVDKGYITRRWQKSAYRYAMTSTGKQYLKRNLG